MRQVLDSQTLQITDWSRHAICRLEVASQLGQSHNATGERTKIDRPGTDHQSCVEDSQEATRWCDDNPITMTANGYGFCSGRLKNRVSLEVPAQVREAVQSNQGGMTGQGTSVWPVDPTRHQLPSLPKTTMIRPDVSSFLVCQLVRPCSEEFGTCGRFEKTPGHRKANFPQLPQ